MKTIKRVFHYVGIVIIYVKTMLGAGVLVLPWASVDLVKSRLVIAWGIILLLSYPIAHTFAILIRDNPGAKGLYSIVEKAFGVHAGALAGWYQMFTSIIGIIIVPLAGAHYIAKSFDLPVVLTYVLAGCILTASVVLNYLGTGAGDKAAVAVGGAIIIGLLMTIISTRWYPLTLNVSLEVSGWTSVMSTTVPLAWSLLNWDSILLAQAQFYNPKRDMIPAVLGAATLTALLNMGVGLSATVIPDQIINPGLASIREWFKPFSLLVLVISLNATYFLVNNLSRVAYWLANDRLAPQWLEHVHARYSTPDRALLTCEFLGVIGLVTTYTLRIQTVELLSVAISLGLAGFLLIAAAGMKLIKSVFGKALASIPAFFCLIAFPFLGSSVWLLLAVTVFCPVYVYWIERNEGL